MKKMKPHRLTILLAAMSAKSFARCVSSLFSVTVTIVTF